MNYLVFFLKFRDIDYSIVVPMIVGALKPISP